MKKCWLLPACILWSGMCFAQDWFTISVDGELSAFAVDLSSIKRVGDRIYCLQRQVFADEERERVPETFRFAEIYGDERFLNLSCIITYLVYDSKGARHQTLSTAFYDIKGNILHSSVKPESDSNYSRLTPDTIEREIFDELKREYIFQVDGRDTTVYIEGIPRILRDHPTAVYIDGKLSVFSVFDNRLYEEPLFTHLEQMPQFPGGDTGLMKYLRDNVVYPLTASDPLVEGVVTIRFVITKDGSISDRHMAIIKSPDRLLNEEAVRVIRAMPNWIPGTQNGRPVNVRYHIPVRIKIPD